MRKNIILLVIFSLAGGAWGDLIWHEDFSDVSDWLIAWEQHADTGATITSDGSHGLLYINRDNSGAAWSPTAFMSFNETTWDTYTLSFDVNNISWSMSYQVGFDEFDGSFGYLSSVTIHPQGTFVGTTNYALSSASWNPSTAYVRPKITGNTGDGTQTLTMNDMQINSPIPEPATLLLGSLGLATLLGLRRRG